MKEIAFSPLKMLFVFLLTAMAFHAYGQKSISKTDSLLTELKKGKQDTNRVLTYMLVSKQFRTKEKYELAKRYTDSAFALSQKLNYYRGQGLAYNSFGIICRRLNDYQGAIKNYNSARSIYQQTGNKKGVAAACNNIGNVFLDQGNYEEALNYFFTSLKIKKEIGDSVNTDYSGSIQNIGNVYYLQGNYPMAIKFYFRSLKLNEKLGDKTALADSYNNLGNIYDIQQDFSEALKNYSAALKIGKETENLDAIAGSFLNIGIVYKHQGNFPKALENYFSAITNGEKAGNKFVLIDAYNSLGNVYLARGDFENALKYNLLALKMSEDIDAAIGISSSCMSIGYSLTKQKKFGDARNYLDRGMAIAKQLGAKEDLQFGYSCLSSLDSAIGNYDRAYANYKLYILYHDSLVNDANIKKMVQAQMQYGFDKKTTADSIRNAEQKKQDDLKHENEIKQQKIYTYGGAIGFLLMLVVAGVSFRAFRQKQKTNAIITLQKEIVEEKQTAIMDSIRYAKKIQRSMLPTEKYIQRNLNRLKE